MNKFYQKSKFFQWSVAILLLTGTLVIMGLWIALIDISGFYWLLIFVLTPVVQFALTPFLTLMGNYKYVSPMLLVFAPSQIKYDLHNGTSFDYLMVLKGYKMGRALKSKTLEYYLEGLLNIVSKIELRMLPLDVEITGSSYFFSDRTAKNLGFEISNAATIEKLNIVINYLDLMWMYSLANGKLSFPRLSNIKNAKISGKGLLECKPILEKYYAYLRSKNNVIE